MGFWFCTLIALASTVVALARPQKNVSVSLSGSVDVIFIQDGSASMRVRDVRPHRWGRSLEFMRNFARALPWRGDRVGLAAFSSYAAPQIRFTRDPNVLMFFLGALGNEPPFELWNNLTWDTNLEEGILWGMRLVDHDKKLRESKNPKAMVLISDGQVWSGSVAAAVAQAYKAHIPLYVVGVGTLGGGIIPISKEDQKNAPVGDPIPTNIHSALDSSVLRQIALHGGGKYFEVGGRSDGSIAVEIISDVKRHGTNISKEMAFQDVYWPFLVVALVALVGAAMFWPSAYRA